MFHLGVVYDYPDITNYHLALDYYRRTLEDYPGTEWARKAQQAIDYIRDLFHEMYRGAHGI
jgi:outer membrane protein assembly factor BamD (BamD/ComL family)